MIQFSFLPGTVPANPTKATIPGAGEGGFAGLLEGEIGQDAATTGKDLPDAGKDLPLPGKAALALPMKLLVELGEGADPERLPVEDHGTMPMRDSDEGPAEDIVAPAKFFLDPMIPFAAPPSAPALPEAAGEKSETLPSGRAAPQPQPPKPDLAALTTKPDTQPQANAAEAKALTLLPSVEVPQDMNAQPADPRLARLVSTTRPAASREFRVELGAEPRPAALPRSADIPKAEKLSTMLPIDLAAPASADATTSPQGVAASRGTTDANAATRPHDFSALIDRLVEARDAARPHSATMAVMHAEFGEVSLRFSQQDGALSVTMSSHDPEFNQAVNAAMPAERGQSDSSGQPHARRDDAAGQAASRGASHSDASGKDSQPRNGREGRRDAIDENNPGAGPQQSGRSRGGIFA